MTTREHVTWLWINGCSNIQISGRLGITGQRVSQILGTPPTLKAKKPRRKPVPLNLLGYRAEPRHHFKPRPIRQVKAILRRLKSWTWAEADAELLRKNLRPPARRIYEFLPDVGFKGSPQKKRWVKRPQPRKC